MSKLRNGYGERVGVVVYLPFSNTSSRTHQVGWGLSGIYLDGRDSLRGSVLPGPGDTLDARKKKKINV